MEENNEDNVIIPIYEKSKQGEEIVDTFEKEMDAMETMHLQNTQQGVNQDEIIFYHDGNSPLTLSPVQSDDEHDNEDNKGFRELSYNEIEQEMDNYYNEGESFVSNELDALITYIKGQKHLNTHAKQYTQYYLNLFMIPSIFISAFLAVITSFLEDYEWNKGLITGLNGLIALLIAGSNYFKFEQKTQTFYLSAMQYDKIETSLEFLSSTMAFKDNEEHVKEEVLHTIREVEKKIFEIKEWNHLFIPNEIHKRFPLISHLNMFSFIKRLESSKKVILNRFQLVKNEIRHIQYHFKHKGKLITSEEKNRMQQRLIYLHKSKEYIKKELYDYRNAYSYIDSLFNQEIQQAENYSWCDGWFHKKDPEYIQKKRVNHVVDQFL